MPEERHLKLHAPVFRGDQELFVARIQGQEALCHPFSYAVTLQARSDSVDFDKVLGQEMSVGVKLPGGGERFIHGYVSSFGLVGMEGDHCVYRAELRPHLWRLTCATNCRIFQKETVPDIVRSILKEHLISDIEEAYGRSNRGPFLAWEYCVQYRETDLAFVSRLLEYEGIHYYFKHEKQRHVLVIADSNSTHGPVPNYESIEHRRAYDPRQRQDERIWAWCMTKTVLPGRTVATDFDFKQPRAQLRSAAGSEVERTHSKTVDSDYETYDHLETVVQQAGYSPKMIEQYARMRTEELHSRFELITAHTDARGLCAGATFKLKDGPSPTKGREYMVLGTELSASTAARASTSSSEADFAYTCRFEAIDTKIPYRPARLTLKPRIAGLQSATVVGSEGKTPFWTNEYGQVRVKFHWDRTDKTDPSCSCWVRVSQNTAGANWGSLYLPHVGHEVLISFLEGDPDRPIVTGNVYNGSNKPPLDVSPNGYKSLTRDVAGNQILLDATPGEECVAVASPKEHTVMKLGKRGATIFTRKKLAMYSYDSESYHFGSKVSYTKGYSWTVDRGLVGSVKAGASFAFTGGVDVKAFLGASADVKLGASLALALNNTFSYTFGREEKVIKGVYRRISKSDALLDSLKTVYICGGERDNTMLTSNDTELVLSFDDSNGGRDGIFSTVDSKARKTAIACGGVLGTMGLVGGGWHVLDVSDRGPERDKDAQTVELDTELERVSGISSTDVIGAGISVLAVATSMRAMRGEDIVNPAHEKSSAKVLLRKELVQVFAGARQETEIKLTKAAGLLMVADRSIELESEKADVKIAAKKELALKSGVAITLDGTVKHRNMMILK